MRRPQYKRRDTQVRIIQREIARNFQYSYALPAPRWTSQPTTSEVRRSEPVLTEVLSGWVGEKARLNSVYHTKETLRYAPIEFCKGPDPRQDLRRFPQYPGFGAGGTAYLYTNVLSLGGISIVPGRPSAPSLTLDWRKCYESLLDDVHGLLPAQKALAVNIAEFTQLKHLVPGIAKSIARIKSFIDRKPNRRIRVGVTLRGSRRIYAYRTVGISSGRWCLRDLAQLHLAHQFGIAPLVEDLAELTASYFRAKEHLNWYRTISDGQEHHVHASVERRVSSESTIANDPNGWYKMTERHEASSHGTLFGTVVVTPESTEVAQKRLFNQILGLNVPLQIAWELVPFSFVMDWFLPVGEVLSRFEPKRFFGSLSAGIRFVSCGHSVKSEATMRRDVTRKNVNLDRPAVYVDARRLLKEGGASRSYTSYERTEGWPAMNLVPPKGHFGLKQVGLSLALVVTRLFK